MVGQRQAKIRRECDIKLQRQLTNVENRFGRRRQGFIALEMIQNTVSALQPEEFRVYLNSVTGGKRPHAVIP